MTDALVLKYAQRNRIHDPNKISPTAGQGDVGSLGPLYTQNFVSTRPRTLVVTCSRDPLRTLTTLLLSVLRNLMLGPHSILGPSGGANFAQQFLNKHNVSATLHKGHFANNEKLALKQIGPSGELSYGPSFRP